MIYLDNAATSFPKPPEVHAAMERCLRELGANPGRAGHRMALATKRMIEETRALAAGLIGAGDPRRVVFTAGATDSLNMAIKGTLEDAQARGGGVPHVITSVLEHNSVSRPLNRLEQAGRAQITRLEPNRDGVLAAEDVGRALRPETRLVALTHCSNVLGTIQPIAEIGAILAARRATGQVWFLVDAAQTAGVVPLDVEALGVDLLAFSGHKGLLGPTGVGVLYVREGLDLPPWREGGTGDDSSLALHPEEMPDRLEAGTPNTVGICGLGAGIRFVLDRGISAILDHERSLLERILDSLSNEPGLVFHGPRGAESRCGVLSLSIEAMEPQDVAAALEASFGVAVRAGLHCAPEAHRWLGTFPRGSVRVSVGPFTTAEEIGALIGALREIARAA